MQIHNQSLHCAVQCVMLHAGFCIALRTEPTTVTAPAKDIHKIFIGSSLENKPNFLTVWRVPSASKAESVNV